MEAMGKCPRCGLESVYSFDIERDDVYPVRIYGCNDSNCDYDSEFHGPPIEEVE